MTSEKPKEIKKKLENNKGKAKSIIEETQLGQILETHEKIKERRKKIERQKKELRNILHSAYWVMLEKKKETTIEDPFILKDGELRDTSWEKVARLCTIAHKAGRDEKKVEQLKQKCQDDYGALLENILDKVENLSPYMTEFFSVRGVSVISKGLDNGKNMDYIVEPNTVKIKPSFAQRVSKNRTKKLDLKTQDGEEVEEILSYADEIEQLQIKTLDDLEQFSRQMKKLKQYILNNLQTQITAATI